MADIWDIVPERFRYLRQAVELCGETQIAPFDPTLDEQYCDELRMLRFFEEAFDHECDELAALADRVRTGSDWPRVLAWLNDVGTRHVRYCREINNLFHLMDMCDFNFEPE